MSLPVILWFRNDLRFHDHAALLAAVDSQAPIIPVYIFDDALSADSGLGFPRADAHRMNYLKASVHAFRQQVNEAGAELYVFKGHTPSVLNALYRTWGCAAIIAHHEYAHEEVLLEQEIAGMANLKLLWGNQLFAPGTLLMQPEQSPFYFTAFKRKVTALKNVFSEMAPIQSVKWMTVPESRFSIPVYKYDPEKGNAIPRAGEILALRHLTNYFQSGHLREYARKREFFDGEGISSVLSPYLSVGALSPNRVMQCLNGIVSGDEEMDASVEKMKEQLIWRDYYRWLFLRYGRKLFFRKGLRKIVPPMYDDVDAFQMWMSGETPHPLINALMKELKTTGWMSNRGRMIAAYYLAKELKVNWLWGAQWFESQLIDYDVCNNYGNWAYQSGTGTDSRINRRFNLAKQIQKFDPDGAFVQKWGDSV